MENIFIGIGTLLLGFGAYLKYEKTLSHQNKITHKEAKDKIKSGAKVVDVRTLAEYNMGHYNGAIHIPAGEISSTKLLNSGINKEDIIIVYCNTGTRARKASEKLNDLGYENVFYIVETYLSLN